MATSVERSNLSVWVSVDSVIIHLRSHRSFFFLSCALLLPLLLGGCAQKQGAQGANAPVPLLVKHGSVHGGQQAVSGSTIQLYAVGTTGDGSAATPLLTQAVITDASGDFNITGDYTCPSATSLVYIVATGGNPGLAAGTNNTTLSMMAALGPCNSLHLQPSS
jgi:trimeric autotransporter adhesin